jgi:CubicO group peptidase (beta-lactamase class C family)
MNMKTKLLTLLLTFAILLLFNMVASSYERGITGSDDSREVQQVFEIQKNTFEYINGGTVLNRKTQSDPTNDGENPLDDPWITFCLLNSTPECLDACINGWVCDEEGRETPGTFKLKSGSSISNKPLVKAKYIGNTIDPTEEFGFKAPSIGTAQFAANIHAQLSNKVVGYAFVIAKNGQLAVQGQGGFARIPVVDGGKAFTVNTDVNVYSVSKTITAIAVLQLMEKLGVEPDDPIADWLPQSWAKGLGFSLNGITFFDLLTHRTGINQTIQKLDKEDEEFAALSTNTYAGVKAIVEHGIYPEFADVGTIGYGHYSYKNANYAIARVIIWQMALETGDITSNSELAADFDSALGYQQYIREHVLQLAGVDGFCYATGPESQRALAYDINKNFFPFQFTRGGSMGGSFPNGLLTAGPKNWWLSAMDLAAVAAHLHYGDLLSSESQGLMDDLEMGWSKSSDSASKPNRYWHGGLGKWTRSNRLQMLSPGHPANPTGFWQPSKVTTKDRVRTCFMKLPDGLDATLVMNSDVRDSSLNACGVIHAAFEDAQ